MSTTNITAFEDTIHKTNIWLNELMDRLDTHNKTDAYRALRVTLHALRDRIPNAEAVQLAAQFPMLIRGFYYDGWNFNAPPTSGKKAADFLAHISPKFKFEDIRLSDREIINAVFGLLKSKISEGEIDDVKSCLPPDLKHLWDTVPIEDYYDQKLAMID
jgi:uncharacterized protein (DUF2267 family)